MVVGDWGSAHVGYGGGLFYGGTPVYAGPLTFTEGTKDLFSFGRLAMELMLDKSGTEFTFSTFCFCFDIFESENKVFLGLTFYPIEDPAILERFRHQLFPFMKAIQKTTTSEFVDNESEILDEIIHTARSGQISNQLSAEWYQFIQAPINRTLNKEHDILVATNLK